MGAPPEDDPGTPGNGAPETAVAKSKSGDPVRIGTAKTAQGKDLAVACVLAQLNGAGQLRDLISGNGLGSWQNVLNAHLDNQDGFNQGQCVGEIINTRVHFQN